MSNYQAYLREKIEDFKSEAKSYASMASRGLAEADSLGGRLEPLDVALTHGVYKAWVGAHALVSLYNEQFPGEAELQRYQEELDEKISGLDNVWRKVIRAAVESSEQHRRPLKT